MNDIKNYIELAIKASIAGGQEILNIYQEDDFGIEYKSDDSPLTKADLASNRAIMQILTKSGLPILSEEGRSIIFEERKDWDQLWIVDPLDGTKEFVKRNGEFTVNIALIRKGEIIGGVVFTPVSGELFFAAEGLGSFKINTNTFLPLEQLLSNAVKLPAARTKVYTIVASRSHLSPETTDFINACKEKYGEIEILSRGSSLKLCMVAEGKANCYPRYAPTMEWDTAAGHAICKFAGKTVLDYKTQQEMRYNRPELLNNWFIVK